MPTQTSDSADAHRLGAEWHQAMAAGDFGRAWAASDCLLQLRAPAERDDPALPYHLRWVWDGRAFDGRRVLVRCYHGLGDTIQFSRYLPALRRRVGHLTLEAPPALIAVLAGIEGPDLVVPFRPEAPAAPADVDLEIMELAHALRLAPLPVPYLAAPARPAGGRLQVGICGRTESTWRPERSVPPEALAPLAAVPGLDLHSLQRDACPPDLADTARRIAGLDLVVTVDTMIAHLAGALGTPVWLLLMAEPDWRWLAGGRASPWYGGVRKYRQRQPGHWHEPVAALTADLTRAAAAGTLAAGLGS